MIETFFQRVRPLLAVFRAAVISAAVVSAVAICAVAAPGCATVAPYERETLSRRSMRVDADPEGDAVRAHVAGAREAALDPGASGGGGCGCN